MACPPTQAATSVIAFDVVKESEGRTRGKIVRYQRKYWDGGTNQQCNAAPRPDMTLPVMCRPYSR